MTERRQRRPDEPLGLAQGFQAWWAPTADSGRFIRDGMIVLDANVLLHLYRVTPAAREQLFATLLEVRNRLWIPHQAALEFHRNRTDVVLARLSQFREVRQILKQAPDKAVGELRKAIARFRALRQTSMTDRDWSPEANGLDESSILARLDGLMDDALSELAEIEAEHDFGPEDLRASDPVLMRLDAITAGRVGPAYDTDSVRQLVDEATHYRFPNEIPPGYKDANAKANSYRAAGDYILWRQVLDYAATKVRGQLLVMVTNDVKEDWWLLDKKGRPVGGRPELKQELFDCSGALMTQMMLSDFLDAVAEQFPDRVSPDTVSQVRESEIAVQTAEELSDSLDSRPDLMNLSPVALEHLVRQLLEAMGYTAFVTKLSQDEGFDIEATRPNSPVGEDRTLIEVKRYRSPVPAETVRALYGAVVHERADRGVIITTSRFGSVAKRFAKDKNLTLIEGPELLSLLREYLDINAVISSRPPRNGDDL